MFRPALFSHLTRPSRMARLIRPSRMARPNRLRAALLGLSHAALTLAASSLSLPGRAQMPFLHVANARLGIPTRQAAARLNARRPRPIQQVLVKLKTGVAPDTFARQFSRAFALAAPNRAPAARLSDAPALQLMRSHPAIGWHVFRLPAPGALADTLDALKKRPEVQSAEPDWALELAVAPPNDGYWGREDWEHTIVVLAGLDGDQASARQDDSAYWTYSWNLETVRALEAWNVWPGHYQTGAERQNLLASDPARLPRVAVIDSGIDFTHPDLTFTGNPSKGVTDSDVVNGGQIEYDLAHSFINGGDDGNPMDASDDVGHGTSVAGIIAAAGNNANAAPGFDGGIIGLGFPARIVPIKVVDANGNGQDSDLISAIEYAADNHCVIMNASLNLDTTSFPQSLQDAVDYAWNKGTLLIAAAGNDGSSSAGPQTRRYPASLVHVLAVGATTYGGQYPGDVPAGETLASYSNYGLSLGVTAPGGDVTTFQNTAPNADDFGLNPTQEYVLIWTLAPTYQVLLSDPNPNNPDGVYAQIGLYGLNYGALPGTSFATPHVAGLAALYASKNRIVQAPGSPQRLLSAIERGAHQMNGAANGAFDTTFGYGRIDAFTTISDINSRNTTQGGFVGQVTVGGTPVNNVSVTIANPLPNKPPLYSAVTFADGIFHMTNVAAGNYTVTTSALGYSGSATVTVVAGSDVHGVNFSLNNVKVVVSPKNITLPFGAKQQFTATVTGTSNTGVIWSLPIDAGAKISANGLLTAPAAPASSTQAIVQATSVDDTSRHDTSIVTFTATISGVATLQGSVARAYPARFEFRPRDGSPTFTRTVTLATNGAFSLNDVPVGDYDVAIKGAAYLQKVVRINATSGFVTNVQVTLLGGDANNDNSVDNLDLGILALSYGLGSGQAGYDARADLNGDGQADNLDLGILANNYGLSGDN